jgi:hypothetical protein
MDYRLTLNEEEILLMAAKVSAKIYHRHRAERNKKYKPKPNEDGAEARGLIGLVILSRRMREAGLTDIPPT